MSWQAFETFLRVTGGYRKAGTKLLEEASEQKLKI
jgi:hypothetical protein